MKKEYVGLDVEIVKLTCDDVIRTSDGGVLEPGVDPDEVFGGGYDVGGWT